MKKHIFIIAFVMLAAKPSHAQSLRHAELLGRPTASSITIQAFFNEPIEAAIQYGTVSQEYSDQTPWKTFDVDEPAEILVSGLDAGTKYYYRMVYRQPGSSDLSIRPEYSFYTQRAPGSTFSFIVQADPHLDNQSDTALYRLCLQNQLADAPDFMIDLGDFLMSDKLRTDGNTIPHDTVPYRCRLLRSYYETTGHSVPLFIALGNHEGESGWYQNGTANNVAIWSTEERKKYFLNPTPDAFYTGDTTHYDFVGLRESYYAWTWGDALFIILDPYWHTSPKPDSLNGWRWTLGKRQYDWLRSTLEQSTAAFKFVFAHQLVGGDPDGRGGVEFADRYEWGGENLDGTPGFAANRPGWYKPVKDLLTENEVTIFFHGHDHFFGKQDKDCLIYQETPQPSHPNFQNAGQAEKYGYFEGQILPNSGHLRVTVSPEGVKVEYVRVYLPQNENNNRHNRDVSATYFIGEENCYDSLATGTPVLWSSNYVDELISPNPFRDEAKIEFSLQHADRLSLAVYDANGLVVRRLLNRDQVQEGKFQIFWDGRNSFGNDLPDGIYFYTLQNEKGEVRTGKMILNR